MKSSYLYYKVVKDRQEYKGVRYFCFDPMAEKIIQVVVNMGREKRGRPRNTSIGLIARLSFMANYLAMGYIEPCTKKEYETNFNKVVNMLK